MAELLEAFLAYAAGFFDADGSVGVYTTKNVRCREGVAYFLTTQVTQKVWSSVLLEWQEHWGGGLFRYEAYTDCLAWRWSLRRNGAAKFLKDILPYLGLKKTQAELAIKFQERMKIPGIDGLSAAEFEWQRSVSEALKEMKRNIGTAPEDVLKRIEDKLFSIDRQLRLWPGGSQDV